MSKNLHSIIETLFVSPTKSKPVNFEWRLIRRRGRPFLLLPGNSAAARIGLNLYSAQRWQAKIWRLILPLLFQTPLIRFFERVCFRANDSAEFVQFMARQVNVAPGKIFPTAIKLNEMGSSVRLVLLLCNERGRPACVIKVGLNAAGRETIEDEANFLAQLPIDKLGCVRMVGRLSTRDLSAFSINYFSGSSPHDDAGLERLFHDWLNLDETALLGSLPVWHKLGKVVGAPNLETWRQISSALTAKTVHTTLYHGDFTPWNVRLVNVRNLQVFDWERGSRQGIPGWDWFHFIIQTAILARRHSVERAAAEVDQLIQSVRFKKYAAAAGITDLVEPLVLAYLLNHIWVTKPSQGGRTIVALFDLLANHWLTKPSVHIDEFVPTRFAKPGLSASVRHQLASAIWQWRNLFWEPSLNFKPQASWGKEFQECWPIVLVAAFILATIGTAQFYATRQILLLPFYIATCALLAWKAGRRWGLLTAAIAAVIAPLVVAVRDVGYRDPEIMLWNVMMRFIILYMCVLFLDRIHKERRIVHQRPVMVLPPVKMAENWAVLVACGLFLAGILTLDFVTNPRLIFLPLYLFPCMMLALVLNLSWGMIAALLATVTGIWVEYLTNKINDNPPGIFVWNFTMRLAVFLLVLFLIQHIRKENIFFGRKLNSDIHRL